MSILFGVLGFLLGILLYICIPVFAPERYRERIADWYWKQGVHAYRRGLLTVTRHGDATIHPSSYDHDLQADKVTTHEQSHYEDRRNAMTRLYGRPLGVVYSQYNEILHPTDIDVARALYETVDDGRHENIVTLNKDTGKPLTDGGDGEEEPQTTKARVFTPYVDVAEEYPLVDLRDVKPRLIESFEPNDPEKGEEDIKNSQQEFKSRNTVEVMIVVIAAVAASVLAWVIWSNTSGDSAVTIPVQIAAGLAGGML